MRFQGKTVIVTGAASGIGRATAARIAREGGRVVAVDISADKLTEFAASLEGHIEAEIVTVAGDITTQESVDALHLAAAKAWQQAFRTVMREAQARFDHDQLHATPEQRTQRARFGSYFYGAKNDDGPSG